MGIPALWKELDHAYTITTLQEEAWAYFKSSPYGGMRLGIDAPLWLFHAKSLPKIEGAGANADLRMLFFRLANLFALPILPVFVFDGSQKPSLKRGMTHSYSAQSQGGFAGLQLLHDFKELIRAFGFIVHEAPGEAEAELAWLSEYGFLDVVLTDDADVLAFGARKVLRK